MKEDGFQIVVGVMGGAEQGDAVLFHTFFEKAVAGLSGRRFNAVARFPRKGGDVFPALSQVQWGCILPLLAGILCTALLTARFVNHLLENRYAVIYHVILGVVCASTLLIIPTSYAGIGQIALCVVCAAVGFVAAMALDKFGTRIKAENNIE